MIKVKICGVTNLEDAEKACEYGADLIGFIFVKDTPRHVCPETVGGIIKELKGKHAQVGMVGLFQGTSPESIAETVSRCDLDYVQLHGNETPGECSQLKKILEEKYGREAKIIKAFKVKGEILGPFTPGDYKDVDYFVFDTYHPEIPGGTGVKFDWEVLDREKEKIKKDFFIAGGLDAKNVFDAVKT
ncbi:MAG: phosphoribosylanthranilate isomerase, partial [Candidatus Omnitrophota bacterium]